jgi:preprotein translocase subunit SecG
MGSGMVFRQTNTYFNNSDRVLYRKPDNQDVSVSLLVQLPPGALILNDTQNPRYIIAQDFYSLIDTNPVFPGVHYVEAIYFLPHSDGEAVIDLEMNNRFEGKLDISVAVPSLAVSGDVIEYVDSETITNNSGEFVVQNYTADYSIPAGGNLVFSVSGALFGSQNTSSSGNVVTGNFLVVVIIVVVLLFVFAIVGLLVLRRRYGQQTPDHQREIDRLLAQINQIEAMHEKGEINHDVFQRQRQELKDKLATLMRNSSVQSDT